MKPTPTLSHNGVDLFLFDKPALASVAINTVDTEGAFIRAGLSYGSHGDDVVLRLSLSQVRPDLYTLCGWSRTDNTLVNEMTAPLPSLAHQIIAECGIHVPPELLKDPTCSTSSLP